MPKSASQSNKRAESISIASFDYCVPFTRTPMIPLRRSPMFAIRIPRSYSRSCISRVRWLSAGAEMASEMLPTLSLQGKVSVNVIFPKQTQVLYGTAGLSRDWGRSGAWE